MTEPIKHFPCFVAHEDAGGQCGEPATIEVYGLNFCARHGREVNLGALLDEQHELDTFLARSHDYPSPVARAFARLDATERIMDTDYWEALISAYPANLAPIDVRERVAKWQRDEEPEYESVVDQLLNTLATLHTLMRIAYEARETWLVEDLERKRESVAAQVGVALERVETR